MVLDEWFEQIRNNVSMDALRKCLPDDLRCLEFDGDKTKWLLVLPLFAFMHLLYLSLIY